MFIGELRRQPRVREGKPEATADVEKDMTEGRLRDDEVSKEECSRGSKTQGVK